EALRMPRATVPSIVRCEAAEFDEARLVGVQFQFEFQESLPQFALESLGVVSMLEADDEVVCVANDNHFATRTLLSPRFHPQVQHVVEVDVRKQRADAPSLRRPF